MARPSGSRAGCRWRRPRWTGSSPGYCLEVVTLDGNSPQTITWDPVIEARNASTAVADPDAIVYVGPFTSGASTISMPITNRASMAQLGPTATYAGLTRRAAGTEDGEPWIYRPQALVNFFRLVIPADMQADAAARWAQRLGARQVFVLHDGEAYGRGVAAAFEAFARKIGLAILANQLIDRAQPDHRALLTKIRASGADLVYMGGRSETGAPDIIRQMAEVGLVAPRVRFMGPDQLLVDTVLEDATCAALMATDTRVTFAGVPAEQMKGSGRDTHEDYVRRFGFVRSNWDLYGVEAGRVAIDGIRRAAEDLGRAATLIERRDVVRKAIAATRNFYGHSGTWSFDRNGDVAYETDDLDAIVSGYRVVRADALPGCAFEFEAVFGR